MAGNQIRIGNKMKTIAIVVILMFCLVKVGYGDTYESIFAEQSKENEKNYSGRNRLAADSGVHSAMIEEICKGIKG